MAHNFSLESLKSGLLSEWTFYSRLPWIYKWFLHKLVPNYLFLSKSFIQIGIIWREGKLFNKLNLTCWALGNGAVAELLECLLSDHEMRVQISSGSICQGGNFLMLLVWECKPGLRYLWKVIEIYHTTGWAKPSKWNWVDRTVWNGCASMKSQFIVTKDLSVLALLK